MLNEQKRGSLRTEYLRNERKKMFETLTQWPWSLITAVIIVGAVGAIIAAFVRRNDRRFMAANTPATGSGAAGGTIGGTLSPIPPAQVPPAPGGGNTQTATTGKEKPLHEVKPPLARGWRILILGGCGLLLFGTIYAAVNYVLGKASLDSSYTWTVSGIVWTAIAVLLFRLFFRTVGVFQVAHTQDMVTGSLRRYGAGTNLLAPWEVLTEDKIVDTEAHVIPIPVTRIATADGSPMDFSGFIRYRVNPEISERFIGVRKDDVEKSLIAIAVQITRAETARCENPEATLEKMSDLITKIQDIFENGPATSKIEEAHGITVEDVPVSIVMTQETEKRLLALMEDKRLAQSATALLGASTEPIALKDRLEATRLALLNNPEAKLSHTISEEQETGTRTFNVNIGGTSGESIKDLAAIAAIAANALASTKQKGGGKPPQTKGGTT